MSDVMFCLDSGEAVVNSRGLSVMLAGKEESVYANFIFPKFGNEFWYIKFPILNCEELPEDIFSCVIDWERMPDDVLSLFYGRKNKKSKEDLLITSVNLLEEELDAYLDSVEDWQFFVKDVIKKIPDRFFYDEGLKSAELASYRQDIDDIAKKMRFASGRKLYDYRLSMWGLQKNYSEELEKLANKNRAVLIFGLLVLPHKKQKELIKKFLIENRLYRYLKKEELDVNKFG